MAERPMSPDPQAWRTYWQQKGEPWRLAPEIAEDRQHELQQRCAIIPAIERGEYPFKGERLTRADVEWLLSLFESRRAIDPPIEIDGRRQGIDLRGAILSGADLHNLPLDGLVGGLSFDEFWDRPPDIIEAAAIHLEGAKLEHASLRGATLLGAHLEDANLREAHLQRAILYASHLEGTFLTSANLAGANLRRASMDSRTNFYKTVVTGPPTQNISLPDVRWNGMDVTVIPWESLPYLGDERRARESRFTFNRRRRRINIRHFENAARANHQVATLLRSQGLAQYADRFAYRAQRWQRAISWNQRKYLPAFGSWLLDILAGYGYKPGRTLFIYLAIVAGFAAAYGVLLAPASGIHLSPLAAVVFSVSSFHGRGFFPGPNIPLDAPITVMAAGEAIVGLLIEISFIATFTQRFFSR